jgi:predicted DNA-binding transcriptional regulator AlpA
MTDHLDRLPPEAILTDKQVCELLQISYDTLWRLEKKGDAPPRIQLSQRRHGRRLADVRRWLAERTVTRSTAAEKQSAPGGEPRGRKEPH